MTHPLKQLSPHLNAELRPVCLDAKHSRLGPATLTVLALGSLCLLAAALAGAHVIAMHKMYAMTLVGLHTPLAAAIALGSVGLLLVLLPLGIYAYMRTTLHKEWIDAIENSLTPPSNEDSHVDKEEEDLAATAKLLGLEGIQINLFENLDTIPAKDQDSIAIIGGQPCKADSFTTESMTRTKAILQYGLCKMYGTHIGLRLFARYGLAHKSRITVADLKALGIGLSTRLTLDDLRRLHLAILQGRTDSYLILDSVRTQFQGTEFDALSYQQLKTLIALFQPKTVPERLPSFVPYLCHHDLEHFKKAQRCADIDASKPGSMEEYLSKIIAYQELKVGSLVDVGSSLYTVREELENKEDGVVCYMLTPIPSQQDAPVITLFRGTVFAKDARDSGASLNRDMHYKGVGASSFAARRDEIVQMQKKALQNSNTKEMLICGHSLGGSDAGRAAIALTEEVTSGELKRLSLVTFNAPKWKDEENTAFALACQKLDQTSLHIHHVRVQKDSLQSVGEVLLGTNTTAKVIETATDAFARADRCITRVQLTKLRGWFFTKLWTRHTAMLFKANSRLQMTSTQQKGSDFDKSAAAGCFVDPEKGLGCFRRIGRSIAKAFSNFLRSFQALFNLSWMTGFWLYRKVRVQTYHELWQIRSL